MPEDIAACIAFLAADEAAFVNGTNLVSDGGLTAGIGDVHGRAPRGGEIALRDTDPQDCFGLEQGRAVGSISTPSSTKTGGYVASGLRVADASIMPYGCKANTCLAAIAIGEHFADCMQRESLTGPARLPASCPQMQWAVSNLDDKRSRGFKLLL